MRKGQIQLGIVWCLTPSQQLGVAISTQTREPAQTHPQ